MAREKQGVGILKDITRETFSDLKKCKSLKKRTYIINKESSIKAGHWELSQYQDGDCGCYSMMLQNSSVMSPDYKRQLFSTYNVMLSPPTQHNLIN